MLLLPDFIFDVTEPCLKEKLEDVPTYRYSQILNWIYKNLVFSPSEMTNIPVELREKLQALFMHQYPKVVHTEKSSDKTKKYLLELYDNESIEFVIIDSKGRNTFCLSTQVGCPVKCKFCASGAFGLTRNLFAGEIVAQFLLGSRILGGHPDNVVFMGIGEPLFNLANLIRSLNIICSSQYINYAARRVTISTSGIPKGIIELADLKRQWNLAVSIHAPDDKTRAKIIPDNCRFPLKEVLAACKYYFESTGRVVTLEYTLLKGINDSLDHAMELAGIAKNLRAKINLIPYNDVGSAQFTRPDKQECDAFANRLKEAGVNVTLRIEKGNKISAACGQLRANSKKNKR